MVTGLGFDWGQAIGGWIGQGINIVNSRYGVPPPGTVITTPGGQVVRQTPGYPTTPGGGYYPPSTVTPGGSVTYPPPQNYTGVLLAGLALLAVVMVTKK